MHPAPSVIVFTVLSGAGFGYLAFLGLGLSTGTGAVAFWQFALGFGMAVAGLVSSTFHLGNPQRALLAFTQWRTSWLSREAWASCSALLVMAGFAVAAIFFGRILNVVGVLGASLCLATVVATSMIYAQMATVPRWNSPLTPGYFIACALTAGAILSAQNHLAVVCLIGLALIQTVCWQRGDRRFTERGHSIASATGLGSKGRTRLFEAPHTGTNYLLKEFGFHVARRHAAKLRVIGMALLCVLPALILSSASGGMAVALAFVIHLAGAFVSRWLFFAEAEHVVQLYYGHQPQGATG